MQFFKNYSLAGLIPVWLFLTSSLLSCSSESKGPGEQIRAAPDVVRSEDSTSANSVSDKVSFQDLLTYPHKVVLTGLPQHRLVTVYKSPVQNEEKSGSGSSRKHYYYYENDENVEHFMPGVDLIFGYNLLNIAHYDLASEQLRFLFEHPVLVKSLYYPSFVQDSIDEKPVNRNYYLVSVYDRDTNADTLINSRDLRSFYHFNASCTEKTRLIPAEYSVTRSQYDSGNDVMYVFARLDENRNGRSESREPLHVFWLDLRSPAPAKRLY